MKDLYDNGYDDKGANSQNSGRVGGANLSQTRVKGSLAAKTSLNALGKKAAIPSKEENRKEQERVGVAKDDSEEDENPL